MTEKEKNQRLIELGELIELYMGMIRTLETQYEPSIELVLDLKDHLYQYKQELKNLLPETIKEIQIEEIGV